MSRLSKTVVHYYVHLFVLCLFTIGVVCSKFLMSMGILIGILNLIFEGNYIAYFSNIRSNKFFIAVSVFYVLHLLGMFWTSDLLSGLDDLKSKATLVLVPIILFKYFWPNNAFNNCNINNNSFSFEVVPHLFHRQGVIRSHLA